MLFTVRRGRQQCNNVSAMGSSPRQKTSKSALDITATETKWWQFAYKNMAPNRFFSTDSDIPQGEFHIREQKKSQQYLKEHSKKMNIFN